MDEGVFVGGMAVALALTVVTARWLRRRLLGEANQLDRTDLDLLAYVSGGPYRAIEAALYRVRLRAAATTQGAPLARDRRPTEIEVEWDRFLGWRGPPREIGDDASMLAALGKLNVRAEQQNLVISPKSRLRVRLTLLPVVAAVAVVAVALFAQFTNVVESGVFPALLLMIAGVWFLSLILLLRLGRAHPDLAGQLSALREQAPSSPVTPEEIAFEVARNGADHTTGHLDHVDVGRLRSLSARRLDLTFNWAGMDASASYDAGGHYLFGTYVPEQGARSGRDSRSGTSDSGYIPTTDFGTWSYGDIHRGSDGSFHSGGGSDGGDGSGSGDGGGDGGGGGGGGGD